MSWNGCWSSINSPKINCEQLGSAPSKVVNKVFNGHRIKTLFRTSIEEGIILLNVT